MSVCLGNVHVLGLLLAKTGIRIFHPFSTAIRNGFYNTELYLWEHLESDFTVNYFASGCPSSTIRNALRTNVNEKQQNLCATPGEQ